MNDPEGSVGRYVGSVGQLTGIQELWESWVSRVQGVSWVSAVGCPNLGCNREMVFMAPISSCCIFMNCTRSQSSQPIHPGLGMESLVVVLAAFMEPL